MKNRKRILAVDDDSDFLMLLRNDLCHHGYDVSTVVDGEEALRLLRSRTFDLLLIDIMMPRMDGHQLAMAIAKQGAPAPPKIIIMTCRDARHESGLALAFGAADLIQKPFGMESLREKIESILE